MVMEKTIKVEDRTKKKLDDLGSKGESYNGILEKHLFEDMLPLPFDEFVQNLPEDRKIKINDLVKYRFPIPLKILMENGDFCVGYLIEAPRHRNKSVSMLKLVLMSKLLGFSDQSKRFGQVKFSIYSGIKNIFLIPDPFRLKSVGRLYLSSEQFKKELPELKYEKRKSKQGGK